MERTATKKGLKINTQKTKIMAVTNTPKRTDVRLNEHKIEQVDHFRYLGVLIDNEGNQEKEMNERIHKANITYKTIKNTIINNRELSIKTKLTVYKTIVQPILTYGSESWIISNKYKSKLQATEMKVLRRIKGVTKMDKIKSQTIRDELEIRPLLKHIESKQLGWLGHLLRMKDTRQTKMIWNTKINAKRRKGRPKTTWEQVIGRILKEKDTDWNNIKQLAQNRKEWKKFCNK